MKITVQMEVGLKNLVGKLIYKNGNPEDIYGKIVDYDFNTGEAIMDMDEEKLNNSDLNPFINHNVLVSNRKMDEDK